MTLFKFLEDKGIVELYLKYALEEVKNILIYDKSVNQVLLFSSDIHIFAFTETEEGWDYWDRLKDEYKIICNL